MLVISAGCVPGGAECPWGPSDLLGEGRKSCGLEDGGQGTVCSSSVLTVPQVDPAGRELVGEGSNLDFCGPTKADRAVGQMMQVRGQPADCLSFLLALFPCVFVRIREHTCMCEGQKTIYWSRKLEGGRE